MSLVIPKVPVGAQLREIFRALRTQLRVIHALVLRESMTRYGEHKLGFLWAILEPLFMVVVFVLLFTFIKSRATGDIPLAIFMLTGIVPFSLFKDNMSQLQNAITSNKAMLGFPQVTTFDLIVARAILETLVILGVFLLFLVAFYAVGIGYRIENPLGVLAACSLLAMIGVGTGFMLASLKPLIPSIQQFTSALLGRPLFLGSGIFFTAESMPTEVRGYLLYNPLLHCIELLRNNFFFEQDSPYGSWSYATAWAVGMLLTGLLIHQVLRKRAVVGL